MRRATTGRATPRRAQATPRRATPAVLVAVVLAAGSVLATVVGCGSKDRGDVAPQAWAGQVCQALTPWRAAIDGLMVQAQRRMDTAKGPDQAKTGLVELLGGAEAASEQARAKVAAAGQPDAGNGRTVAAEFTESLRRTRDAYGKAKTTVAALPTQSSKTFYDSVSAAFGQLTTEYSAGALNLDKVSSPELRKAFDEVPACR
jgi:hypothetical protein